MDVCVATHAHSLNTRCRSSRLSAFARSKENTVSTVFVRKVTDQAQAGLPAEVLYEVCERTPSQIRVLSQHRTRGAADRAAAMLGHA